MFQWAESIGKGGKGQQLATMRQGNREHIETVEDGLGNEASMDNDLK